MAGGRRADRANGSLARTDGSRRSHTAGRARDTATGWPMDMRCRIRHRASQAADVHDLSVVIDPAAYAWRNTRLARATVGRGGDLRGACGHARRVSLRDARSCRGWTHSASPRLNSCRSPISPDARNWGYDGVLPYAPDASYGTPEDLKALVDAAHELGLMMFLDVVYNHFGPDGNYLSLYAPQFFREDMQTPWGPAIDFRRPRGSRILHGKCAVVADGISVRRSAFRRGSCDRGTGLGR